MNGPRGSFKYTALGPDEIRLIELHPGVFESDVACTLRHVRQAQQPTYDALSYVWGDPDSTGPIRLNATAISATSNLLIALKYLRYIDKRRVIWVDALCINQKNDRERTDQVEKMNTIYQNAASVITWIGEDIKTPDSYPEESAEVVFSFITQTASEPKDNTVNFEGVFKGRISQNITKTAIELFRRPWFTRRWVIQEITMASLDNAYLLCGRERIAWSQVVTAVENLRMSLGWLEVSSELFSVRFDNIFTIKDCIKLRRRWNTNPSGTSFATRLGQLLLLTDGLFHATDPRDHIYSMIGIAASTESESKSDILKPNYRKMPATVFTNLAKFLLEERKNLDIILGYRDPKWNTPSWVPTWSHNNMESRPKHLLHLKTREPPSRAEFRLSSSAAVLFLRGLRVGNIQVVGVSRTHEELLYVPKEGIIGAMRSGLAFLFNSWEDKILDSELVVQRFASRDTARLAWKEVLFHPEGKDQAFHDHGYYDHLLGYSQLPGASFGSDLKALGPSMSFVQEFFLGKTIVFADERAFATSNGDFGLTEGRYTIEIGDQIIICAGLSVPLVLRQTRRGMWWLLGPCYLHGHMETSWQQIILESSALEEFAIE